MPIESAPRTVVIADEAQSIQKTIRSLLIGFLGLVAYFLYQQTLDVLILVLMFLGVIILVCCGPTRTSIFDAQRQMLIVKNRWFSEKFIQKKEIPFQRITHLVISNYTPKGRGKQYFSGVVLTDEDRQALQLRGDGKQETVMAQLQQVQTVLKLPIVEEDAGTWASNARIKLL